jgi:hypothetical protein
MLCAIDISTLNKTYLREKSQGCIESSQILNSKNSNRFAFQLHFYSKKLKLLFRRGYKTPTFAEPQQYNRPFSTGQLSAFIIQMGKVNIFFFLIMFLIYSCSHV